VIRGGLVLLVAAYLLSGCYVVGSDERAVVRRFGRMSPEQRGSGLHWDWPRPFVSVDRVNVAALQTLSVGAALPTSTTLLPDAAERPIFVLTGDENFLRLRASVQYRVDPESVRSYLFGHQDLALELHSLIEATLIEASSEAGVDFVLTSGIGPLNSLLTERLERGAKKLELGIDVDRVTLDAVDPPSPVLADFLDVANARSEASQAVQQARTFAEQRSTAANATAQENVSKARGVSRSAVVAAGAAANRFERLVDEFEQLAQATGGAYADHRERTIRGLTRELHRELLTAGVRSWVFDGQRPVDLQFLNP